MAFVIKDYQSIVGSQLEFTRGLTSLLTDFNIGSVIRSIIEAHSIEIDDLYQAMYINLQDAIPTALYTAFSFPLLAATYSSGKIQFTLSEVSSEDITIDAGTIVRRPGFTTTYLTLSDLTIPVGELVGSVNIRCDTIGSVGNTLADTITEIISGIRSGNIEVSATNLSPLTNGKDIEGESSRKSRFISYVNSFSRATEAAVIYGAKLARLYDNDGLVTEYVTRVGISVEKPGRITLYIASGEVDASDELIALVAKILNGYIDEYGKKIEGYISAGESLVVLKSTQIELPISGTLYISQGYTFSNVLMNVYYEIDNYLTTIDPGSTLYRSNLISVISNVSGVKGVDINLPSNNINLSISETLVRGTTAIIQGE